MIAHTIAAVLLELAYLSTGILLCYMGRKLLEKGVEGKTRLEGEIDGNKWVLLTSSPGIVFALCGLGIIIYAIVTPSEYEETLKNSSSISETSEDLEHSEETIVISRLLGQSSAPTALLSRVTIYALQHRMKNMGEEDVSTLIADMPINSEIEPWPQTYNRFFSILRKNPAALSEILSRPQYAWLAVKDQKTGDLTQQIEIELKELSINQ